MSHHYVLRYGIIEGLPNYGTVVTSSTVPFTGSIYVFIVTTKGDQSQNVSELKGKPILVS